MPLFVNYPGPLPLLGVKTQFRQVGRQEGDLGAGAVLTHLR